MLQVRIDDEIKSKANALFNALGIDLSTAVRMFIYKCLAVRGLPFEIKIDEKEVMALAALENMGKRSKALGNDKLTSKEVNQIIDETRKQKKQ